MRTRPVKDIMEESRELKKRNRSIADIDSQIRVVENLKISFIDDVVKKHRWLFTIIMNSHHKPLRYTRPFTTPDIAQMHMDSKRSLVGGIIAAYPANQFSYEALVELDMIDPPEQPLEKRPYVDTYERGGHP